MLVLGKAGDILEDKEANRRTLVKGLQKPSEFKRQLMPMIIVAAVRGPAVLDF